MEVSLRTDRWAEFKAYIVRPQTKTAIIAAAILGGSFCWGCALLPTSKILGEVVLVTGASFSWAVWFTVNHSR